MCDREEKKSITALKEMREGWEDTGGFMILLCLVTGLVQKIIAVFNHQLLSSIYDRNEFIWKLSMEIGRYEKKK